MHRQVYGVECRFANANICDGTKWKEYALEKRGGCACVSWLTCSFAQYGKMHDDNEFKCKCKLYNREHWQRYRTFNIIQCRLIKKRVLRTCMPLCVTACEFDFWNIADTQHWAYTHTLLYISYIKIFIHALSSNEYYSQIFSLQCHLNCARCAYLGSEQWWQTKPLQQIERNCQNVKSQNKRGNYMKLWYFCGTASSMRCALCVHIITTVSRIRMWKKQTDIKFTRSYIWNLRRTKNHK